MKPPLTLAATFWASTVMVGALTFTLALIADQPLMAIAAGAVLMVTAWCAIPEPREATK